MGWKRGSRRDGILGGILIFVLPVLILVVAAAFWWGNLGTDDMLGMEPAEIRTPIQGM